MDFAETNVHVLITISLKFVYTHPSKNNSKSVQVVVWCPTGDEPLSELKAAQLIVAYIRY